MSELDHKGKKVYDVSICIITYKRPELLRKLIQSLQDLDTELNCEVVIVDNDRNESARDTVNSLKNEIKLPLHYHVEPEQNISLARNSSVRNAMGKWIAFVDDDEYVDPDWLNHFAGTQKKFNADVLFGPVVFHFDEKTYHWKKTLFIRKNMPTGFRIKNIRHVSTNNCFIKKEILLREKGPFNRDFGLSGSSDVELFDRILKGKAKLIWCNEAAVHEIVQPRRTKIDYLIKRHFRLGNCKTKFYLHKNKGIMGFMKVFFIVILRSVGEIGISTLCFVKNIFSRPKDIPSCFFRIPKIAGYFFGLTKIDYEFYMHENG